MAIVTSPALRQYQERRADEKRRAEVVAEVKANNPTLSDAQAQAIADGAIRSRDAQRQMVKAKGRTHRRHKPRKATNSQGQVYSRNTLAQAFKSN